MLLFWMAVLAVVFAICAKWPIEETYSMSYEVPGAPGTYRVELQVSERPPKLLEFLVRVGISLAVLALVLPIGRRVARAARTWWTPQTRFPAKQR
jgi:hypothetical protein